MDKCLLVVPPTQPTRRITQGFMERRAQFVDRAVKSEFEIHLGVVLHRSREGFKEIAIVGRRCFQIIGVIKGVLAGRQVLGVMPSARVRTNGINRAPAILQKRADDVLRDVLKRRQRPYLCNMSLQANHQIRRLLRGEMIADVVGDQEDLMSEHIDPERTANPAALTASQLHPSLLDDLMVESIDKLQRHLGSAIKLLRGERVRDVIGKFVDRVFGHVGSSLARSSQSARS